MTINKQVVRALEGNLDLHDLNEGTTPGNSRAFGQYNEDLKKLRKLALESQEQGTTSEYSGPSSVYGQYSSTSTSGAQQSTQEMEMRNVGRNI